MIKLRFQRFFSDWCHVYTIPPTLLGTLEGYTLEYIQKQVSNCLTKVYMLCEYIANTMREKVREIIRNWKEIWRITNYRRMKLREIPFRQILNPISNWDRMKIPRPLDFVTRFHSILQSIDVRDALHGWGSRAARYLPESTILEFLLHVESPVLETVQDRLRMYSDMSPGEFWDGEK